MVTKSCLWNREVFDPSGERVRCHQYEALTASSTLGMGPLDRASRSSMGSGDVEREVVLGQ
jgi:hypothetical protein